MGGGVGGTVEFAAGVSASCARSKASNASAFSSAISTFLLSEDDVVLCPEIVEDGGLGGSSETTDVGAGRKAGYVIWLAFSVLVADDRELTLLTLDFALDLELANCDNFDFFSLFSLTTLPGGFTVDRLFTLGAAFTVDALFALGASFSVFSLLESSAAALIDFFVSSDTWDGPCCWGRLDLDT